MKKTVLGLAAFGLAVGATAAQFNGVDLAPGEIHAKDLSVLKNVRNVSGDPLTVVKNGQCLMTVVYAPHWNQNDWAAKHLAAVIFDMTGVKPKIVEQKNGKPVPGPAFYIGATAEAKAAGLEAPTDSPHAYRVVTKGGSVYFLGRADYAVTDWCERELGARYYWPENANENYGNKSALVYGKCVVKTKGLAVRPCDWDDRPVFGYRENWPYGSAAWNRWGKGGNCHRGGVNVHAPHNWWKEKDAMDHVEIFALTGDGKRPTSPLLCYGNPKSLEYYEFRVKQGIEAQKAHAANKDPKKGAFKDPSGGILNYGQKVVTISQWDCGVGCSCEYCKKLFDEKLGSSGSGSPIIWGYFTKNFAKWLKANYPDWKIAILPYINTCDVPPDPNDPSKPLSLREEGNVEAMLCTMPGLAMLKNKACKQHEEDLIHQWQKCTGNRVLNWHYSCWPAEFTSAPFVYGETIQKHYCDLEHDLVGTFINGGYDNPRLSLSAYVWMRCLWNPHIDVQAIYDGFATRMFGKAAAPMRKLIAMQEGGWNRQWESDMCSVKNIYTISYPRAEVIEMQKLLDEAQKLAAGDEKALARIAWYRQGFVKFFKESEENASGTAFVPLKMKKAVATPKVDGKLDDACWATAEGLPFSKKAKMGLAPTYATEIKAVWYPGEDGGVTFGFRCTEPATSAMKEGVLGDPWGQDNTEVFLDVSGSGDGHFYQILTDASGRICTPTDGIEWKPKGIKTAVALDNGFWCMEVFVPFSDLKNFPKGQFPTTSANGVIWTGNFCRWRVGDMRLPKDKRCAGSVNELTRCYTRGSGWNKDPAAFAELKFVE